MAVSKHTGPAINMDKTVTQMELIINGRKPNSPFMGRQLLENNKSTSEWLPKIIVDLKRRPKNKMNGRVMITTRQMIIQLK
jgi:hypothetical protein